MISYVLVAFVAISLVVSSIMIGVITYISVLERKKEIGILRSIGASKGDISRVFNAETVIVGFVAGAIGIGITALACIPANAIVYSLFDVADVASLPWQAAVMLVPSACSSRSWPASSPLRAPPAAKTRWKRCVQSKGRHAPGSSPSLPRIPRRAAPLLSLRLRALRCCNQMTI